MSLATARWSSAPRLLGLDTGGPVIERGTLRALTFKGHLGVSVPAGQYTYSDPVVMSVSDQQTLAVNVFVSNADLVSVHPCCTTMKPLSYFAPNGGGNLTASLDGAALTLSSPFPRWVDAVDVLQTTGRGASWWWATPLLTATTRRSPGRAFYSGGLTPCRDRSSVPW